MKFISFVFPEIYIYRNKTGTEMKTFPRVKRVTLYNSTFYYYTTIKDNN